VRCIRRAASGWGTSRAIRPSGRWPRDQPQIDPVTSTPIRAAVNAHYIAVFRPLLLAARRDGQLDADADVEVLLALLMLLAAAPGDRAEPTRPGRRAGPALRRPGRSGQGRRAPDAALRTGFPALTAGTAQPPAAPVARRPSRPHLLAAPAARPPRAFRSDLSRLFCHDKCHLSRLFPTTSGDGGRRTAGGCAGGAARQLRPGWVRAGAPARSRRGMRRLRAAHQARRAPRATAVTELRPRHATLRETCLAWSSVATAALAAEFNRTRFERTIGPGVVELITQTRPARNPGSPASPVQSGQPGQPASPVSRTQPARQSSRSAELSQPVRSAGTQPNPARPAITRPSPGHHGPSEIPSEMVRRITCTRHRTTILRNPA